MTCPCCNGDQFLRRLAPHPGVKGCMVPFVRVCPKCKGTGKVPDSGNLFATLEKEQSYETGRS